MKTTSIFTKTTALAVCIFSAVPSVWANGNGKVVKTATKAALTAPRATRGQIQRFTFPSAATARIRAAVKAGQLERTINDAALQYSPVPAPVVLGNTPKEIAFSMHQLVSAFPLEKEVLQIIQQEEQFYAPEIAAARELHKLLVETPTLNEEQEAAMAAAILEKIKNHSLQTYLLKSLANKDTYMLNLDLTEYFSLDKPVGICAFNYTLRHPHQQILMTRRLLNNPLVDETTKVPLQTFLNKAQIKPEEFPAFQQAISDVYTQYQQRLSAAKESDIIQTQINYYKELLTRLDDFVARHGRIPKWNTINTQEIQLFNEIEWIQFHMKDNQFEPFASYHRTLNSILQKAQPAYLTIEETKELFGQFVKTTHRSYPRSLHDKPKIGEIPFKREEELWDNLAYWRIKDPSLYFNLMTVYGQNMK